jgi:hypothetical protein
MKRSVAHGACASACEGRGDGGGIESCAGDGWCDDVDEDDRDDDA